MSNVSESCVIGSDCETSAMTPFCGLRSDMPRSEWTRRRLPRPARPKPLSKRRECAKTFGTSFDVLDLRSKSESLYGLVGMIDQRTARMRMKKYFNRNELYRLMHRNLFEFTQLV